MQSAGGAPVFYKGFSFVKILPSLALMPLYQRVFSKQSSLFHLWYVFYLPEMDTSRKIFTLCEYFT